jgi:TolB-like protein
MNTGPDIFLSYNREDQAVAKRFAEAFEAAGLSVWWDVTLRSGDAYDKVTEEALRTARAVVVLWSPRSVESRWVRAEASIADENRTLVPARIEACQLPVMFRLTQTADLSNWHGEAGDPAWRAFLADVRRTLGCGDQTPVVAAPAADAVSSCGGMPVVAVLPIKCRADERIELLADDLTEDITRELSQCFYCRVIAASTMSAWGGRTVDHRALLRELGARYAIEGRLKRSAEDVHLSAQMVETGSDSVVWSSRFSCRRNEFEQSPEEFALRIVIGIDQAIAKIEMAQAQAKWPPCSGWEHLLRALALMNHHANPDRIIQEARGAVAADPDFAPTHAMLAIALSSRLLSNSNILGDLDRREIVRESLQAVRRAMELHGHDPGVLILIANTYCQLGDAEAGLRLARQAIALAPNSADAQYALGFANFSLGRTAEAIDAFTKQDRIGLSALSRMGGQLLLGICLFIKGMPLEAEAALDRTLTIVPTFPLSLMWKAIVATELGKKETAEAAIRHLREVEPGKSVDDCLHIVKHLPIEHRRKYEAIEILHRLLEETKDAA